MLDCYGREIHYLRLSITDLCNLRCRYCMPDGILKVAHEEVLSFEEMERIVLNLSKLGIDTVRITGGEPLVKRDMEVLMKKIHEIPGIRHISMTTNGVLLQDKLPELLKAGLNSVNISLDTLKRERFQEITGVDALENVFTGIKAAEEAGIPVKINCVPQKGINEDELVEIAEIARDRKVEVRFIELMPIGQGAYKEGIHNKDLLKNLEEKFGTLLPVKERQGFGPAVCYSIDGFAGTIGFISAMHGKFCGSCNRVRLTSKGLLKCCLASDVGLDLKGLLAKGVSDEELLDQLKQTIYQKPMEHHFMEAKKNGSMDGMYQIGG